MKRIVKLTERDLTRIVKRVINESMFGHLSSLSSLGGRKKRGDDNVYKKSREVYNDNNNDDDLKPNFTIHDVISKMPGEAKFLSDPKLTQKDKDLAWKIYNDINDPDTETTLDNFLDYHS